MSFVSTPYLPVLLAVALVWAAGCGTPQLEPDGPASGAERPAPEAEDGLTEQGWALLDQLMDPSVTSGPEVG